MKLHATSSTGKNVCKIYSHCVYTDKFKNIFQNLNYSGKMIATH